MVYILKSIFNLHFNIITYNALSWEQNILQIAIYLHASGRKKCKAPHAGNSTVINILPVESLIRIVV